LYSSLHFCRIPIVCIVREEVELVLIHGLRIESINENEKLVEYTHPSNRVMLFCSDSVGR